MGKTAKGWMFANSEAQSLRDIACGHCNISSAALLVMKKHFVDEKLGPRFEHIYVCRKCDRPTYFDDQKRQYPSPLPGDNVQYLPSVISDLYREARRAVSVGSHTAAVMLCRTVLMHIAVEQGAQAKNEKGRSLRFIDYISYLKEKNIVPSGVLPALDKIKDMGNEAVHDLVIINEVDAVVILEFIGVLLKSTYELPGKVKQALGQFSSQAKQGEAG